MWELDSKENRASKKLCFWNVMLERTLESPLESKEMKPIHPKGNQLWIFIGSTDAETEAPILWPPDANNWLIGNNPNGDRLKAGVEGKRGWDGWMASLNNVYELEKITGNSEGQAMAPHSSTLAWKIPWMEEPDGLPSMGSHRVRQDWSDLAAAI